jgi:hypothetical protein
VPFEKGMLRTSTTEANLAPRNIYNIRPNWATDVDRCQHCRCDDSDAVHAVPAPAAHIDECLRTRHPKLEVRYVAQARSSVAFDEDTAGTRISQHSDQGEAALASSSPLRVAMAFQIERLMPLSTNRALPSAFKRLMPPGCLLRAVRQP